MEDNFKALKEILRGDLIIGSITHENAPPGKDCYEDCGVLKDASGNPLGKQGGKHKRCMDCWNEYIDKLATQIDALYQKRIEQVFEAYDNMLDGMGLGRDNFKVSDWDYVQSLKAKIKEE